MFLGLFQNCIALQCLIIFKAVFQQDCSNNLPCLFSLLCAGVKETRLEMATAGLKRLVQMHKNRKLWEKYAH